MVDYESCERGEHGDGDGAGVGVDDTDGDPSLLVRAIESRGDSHANVSASLVLEWEDSDVVAGYESGRCTDRDDLFGPGRYYNSVAISDDTEPTRSKFRDQMGD